MFVCFTTDMTMLTWLDCHLRAFRFFGGVTAEVLIDNVRWGSGCNWSSQFVLFINAKNLPLIYRSSCN